MDELVVFELTCGYCAKKFVVCRPDYRGQGYCKDACRELEQAALRRLANAKHQRSEEGRRDHAEHQRALVTRKRAEAQAVTDVSRQKVAPHAEWSAPEDPPMLTTSKAAADGDAVALTTVERGGAAAPVLSTQADPVEPTLAQKIQAQLASAASPLTATALRKLCRVRHASLTAVLTGREIAKFKGYLDAIEKRAGGDLDKGLEAEEKKIPHAAVVPEPKAADYPPSWGNFDPAHNAEFKTKLEEFRGTDFMEQNYAGGEGAVYLGESKTWALKRWFAKRIGDMATSIAKLRSARSDVTGNPDLAKHIDVVEVHETGSDWIVRDFVTGSEELKSFASGPAEVARTEAIKALGPSRRGRPPRTTSSASSRASRQTCTGIRPAARSSSSICSKL